MSSTKKPHAQARAANPKAHVRGSALLLSGRCLSLALNFSAQILTVRYLTKSDYGALAFVLALVTLGFSLNIFSFSSAIGRFTAIYHEQRENGRILGAIVLSLAAIAGFGLSAAVLVYALQGFLVGALSMDPLAISLLLTMIALAPIEAFDALLLQLLAAFGGAKSVFLRRHVLGPGLRLAAVASVVFLQADVHSLALAYLIAGSVGITLYASLMVHIFRKQGILSRATIRKLQIPFRDILGFSVPLLSSDLFFLVRTSLLVLLIQYFHSAETLAEFRAVIPVTRLNVLVQVNFAYLFVPIASRLLARGAHDAVEGMYWKSVGWVAILTFPVFAATCLMAEPMTVLFFGERYASSGAVLAILAIGSYAQAVQAFDTETLKVLGRVRYIVVSDVVASVLALLVGLIFVPKLGAIGAALTSTAAIVARRTLSRIFLWHAGGIGFPSSMCLRIYGGIAVCAGALKLLQSKFELPLVVGIGAAMALAILLARVNRDLLDIGETFPELRRIPALRFFFARSSPTMDDVETGSTRVRRDIPDASPTPQPPECKAPPPVRTSSEPAPDSVLRKGD